MSSLSFQNTFIILSKASVTVGTLARKMNTAIAFFVYLWQWISNRNDLLYIGENLGCIMFSLAKSVALSKKFTSFNPRKLLCKLKVSNYQYTGKIVWENKSRYIPCIIIIYHCYHCITLFLFFTYQMPKERFFLYNQMLHTFFWFICTFRESIHLQTSCHLVILRKCYKLCG